VTIPGYRQIDQEPYRAMSCRCGLEAGKDRPTERPETERVLRGGLSLNVCTRCGGLRREDR